MFLQERKHLLYDGPDSKIRKLVFDNVRYKRISIIAEVKYLNLRFTIFILVMKMIYRLMCLKFCGMFFFTLSINFHLNSYVNIINL